MIMLDVVDISMCWQAFHFEYGKGCSTAFNAIILPSLKVVIGKQHKWLNFIQQNIVDIYVYNIFVCVCVFNVAVPSLNATEK